MPTLLIVEDELPMMQLFKTITQIVAPSITVQTALGGQAAIRWLEAETPNLILLDMAMPNVDGTEVLRYIASQPRLAETVVIVVTAVAGRVHPDVLPIIDALLVKPIGPKDIERLLARYLNVTPRDRG